MMTTDGSTDEKVQLLVSNILCNINKMSSRPCYRSQYTYLDKKQKMCEIKY
jgi:hypothetical protein